MISNWEKVVKWAQLREATCQAWLNQPPIQFPLCLESPIRNAYSNTNSSHVGDKGNEIEVGMDDFLRDTCAMEGMLLDAF